MTMRSAKELIGKPIYSLTNGRLIGSVKDLYVDSDLQKVTGVYVGSEGIFNRRARLIPRDQVGVFGIDAVLVVESNVIKDDKEYVPSQDWLRREDLQGRVMHTAGGTKVASVGDLLLDEDTKIVAFSLSRVHVEGPISNNRVVSRTAILDPGGLEGNMIVDLSEVEKANIGEAAPIEPVEFEATMQSAADGDEAEQSAEVDLPE